MPVLQPQKNIALILDEGNKHPKHPITADIYESMISKGYTVFEDNNLSYILKELQHYAGEKHHHKHHVVVFAHDDDSAQALIDEASKLGVCTIIYDANIHSAARARSGNATHLDAKSTNTLAQISEAIDAAMRESDQFTKARAQLQDVQVIRSTGLEKDGRIAS